MSMIINSFGTFGDHPPDPSDIGGIDANTVLMLHMDGTDESKTFTDDSDSEHTVTANGDAQIDTAQKKFGTGAGLFDGNGDYLSVPDSADFSFGSGDFCVDGWLYPNDLTGTQTIISKAYHGINKRSWNIDSVDGELQFWYSVNGSDYSSLVESGTSLVTGSWQHIAVAYTSGNFHMYYNGTRVATVAFSSGLYTNDITLKIGTGEDGSVNFWNGHIDELRISKGAARIDDADDPLYCGGTPADGFTPPAYSYTDKR
jgi:hypothetical protein